MGSKRAMLANGLGHILTRELQDCHRFYDLFAGSGAVACFAAERTDASVVAVDLQAYSAVLAGAVIRRTSPARATLLTASWLERVDALRRRRRNWTRAENLEGDRFSRATVGYARALCSEERGGVIWRAYGGHYFSPRQAVTLDAMLELLPEVEPRRTVCLATALVVAIRVAASPGHTAQPFQPTKTALPYIRAYWNRDPLQLAEPILKSIAARHARRRGSTRIEDALSVAGKLRSGDVAFIDPPYSAVQYSRFYHVLETLALGRATSVHGRGRYPPFEDRPQSAFSKRSEASSALLQLLTRIASTGARGVLTFPDEGCSNGLSGDAIRELAAPLFNIKSSLIDGRFSTMGGNNSVRAARHPSSELVLTLTPRRAIARRTLKEVSVG